MQWLLSGIVGGPCDIGNRDYVAIKPAAPIGVMVGPVKQQAAKTKPSCGPQLFGK
jgi:hypothetical protein